jgi:hypothetical protein
VATLLAISLGRSGAAKRVAVLLRNSSVEYGVGLMRRIKFESYPAWALATALLGCAGEAQIGGESSSLRTLTGEEVAQVLTGNTLVGRDGKVPFWMHYPSRDTVWGLASSGDVDIGRWWTEGNRYCRSWRHWRDGRAQCWLFATDGSAQLLWIEPTGGASGESTVQPGNSIGQVGQPQLVSNLIGSDAGETTAPYGEEVPVDATGAILLTSYRVAGGGRSDGIDAGSLGRGGGSGGNAGASGGSSGSGTGSSSGSDTGSSSGGGTGSSSGSGSSGGSGGGSSGGDDDGGGGGKGKGKGKGRGGGDDD